MEAICAVCGQRSEGDVVHCLQCEGVYHRECWLFFGSCSRYACGGIAFADGFPATAEASLVIDADTPEPPPPAGGVARPGEEAYVQLGVARRETEYGQALTLLNRHRVPFRTHLPRRVDPGHFAAWLYVPYSAHERARNLIEDELVEMQFTPLARSQDLVNYPWALAATFALALLVPQYKAALAVAGLIAICGRDVKDRSVRLVRRISARRRPVLPPGKEPPEG